MIAGCGTSQAAKHALRWPAARVTGIDFSATSVRHTEELKQKYELDNLEVHQLPLTEVGELGATFDQIVCTGVLHHLPDPDAGLAALRDVLAPGGVMHLMLYAPYGRTGVYMLQEFCRRLGIEADRRRNPGARHRPRRAAVRTSAGNAAARGARLSERGGARRCAAAPAGPRLLGAGAVRVPRTVRAAVRPVGEAGALQPPLRPDGAPPADGAPRAASAHGPARRRRAVSGDDGLATASSCIATTTRGAAHERQLQRRRLAALRADSGARHHRGRGAVAPRRGGGAHQPEPQPHRHLSADRRARRSGSTTPIDGARTIGELAEEQGQRETAGPFFQRLGWHDQVVFDASASEPISRMRQ